MISSDRFGCKSVESCRMQVAAVGGKQSKLGESSLRACMDHWGGSLVVASLDVATFPQKEFQASGGAFMPSRVMDGLDARRVGRAKV